MAVIDKQIDYADGDAYSSLDCSMFCDGETIIRIGNSSVCGKCRAFGRFTEISGLGGTIITVAYIELYYAGQEGVALYKIYTEKAESPAQITSAADHYNRVRTTAGVDWDGTFQGGWQQSPSLVSVIQELADSYDPTAIQILIENDGATEGNSADWFAYEYYPPYSMKLHIEYSEAGGVIHYGTTIMVGQGILASAGVINTLGKTILSGIGSLTAIGTGGIIYYGKAVVSGMAKLAAIGRALAAGKTTLAGIGNLTAILEGNGMTPYNVGLCQFQVCQNLLGNKCQINKCIFNQKRIRYWEVYNVYPC